MIIFQDKDKYTPTAVINWYLTEASTANVGPMKEISASMVFSVTVTNWKGVAW